MHPFLWKDRLGSLVTGTWPRETHATLPAKHMENPPPALTPKDEQPAAKTSEAVAAQRVDDLTKDLIGMQRLKSENTAKVFDRAMKAHENGALFYEKLILFDVGTIALSLTLLGQIAAHTPGGHVPRHAFLWFLCPAWLLLLLSIQCCAQRITNYHNANVVLLKQMSDVFSQNHLQELNIFLGRLSGLIKGITLPSEQIQQLQTSLQARWQSDQGFAGAFTKMQDALAEVSKAQTDDVSKLLQKNAELDRKTGVAARLAIIATTVALVLICIFAIQSILHV